MGADVLILIQLAYFNEVSEEELKLVLNNISYFEDLRKYCTTNDDKDVIVRWNSISKLIPDTQGITEMMSILTGESGIEYNTLKMFLEALLTMKKERVSA